MALTCSDNCYSTVLHDNHMQATSRECDWRINIQKLAPESVRCDQTISFIWGWGLGTRLYVKGGWIPSHAHKKVGMLPNM